MDDKIVCVECFSSVDEGSHHKKFPYAYVKCTACGTSVGGIIVRMIFIFAPQRLQLNVALGFNDRFDCGLNATSIQRRIHKMGIFQSSFAVGENEYRVLVNAPNISHNP